MISREVMRIDFAALDTLCRLHRTRSFTRTAEELAINQSAVSYTIDKLRRSFGDPLFVKEGNRQVPTTRCDALIPEISAMIDEWKALATPVDFNPGSVEAEVTLLCNYYERQLFLPRILERLRARAPGIRLAARNAMGQGRARLLAGEGDLLLGPLEQEVSGFATRALMRERYVCVMDPAHPQAGCPVDLEAYLNFEHVQISYDGGWRSNYLQELDRLGHKIVPQLQVPSLAGIESLILGSALVATVPERLTARLADALAIAACPVPAEFQIGATWTGRTETAVMQRWFRELVFDVITQFP